MGVGAGGRGLVGAPAAEVGEVAEAVALHVLVSYFDDEFDTDGLPGEVLAGVPAGLAAGHAAGGLGGFVGPIGPGVVAHGVFAIGLEAGHEFLALGGGEAGADAYVLELAGVVIEAEEEGADGSSLPVFVPTEAGDDAIAVALMLDLEQGALVGGVGAGERLGDDAVEAGAFEAGEPILSGGAVLRGGSQVQGRVDVGEGAFEFGAAGGEGLVAEVAAVELEEVEEDYRGGRLGGEGFDAGGCGVDAEGEGVEVEAGSGGDDDFAVENTLRGELLEEGFAEFGKVAVEGLAVAALDEEVVAVAEDEGAEAVPLGLEGPGVGVGGDGVDALGEHGEDRGVEGGGHGWLDAEVGEADSRGRVESCF